MFNRVASTKTKPSEKIQSIQPKPTPAGRERLSHFDSEAKKAEAAISELDQRINRLESIILDADVAHRALQSQIESDNGASLANYAAGSVPADSAITKLVVAADNTKRAAAAAHAALPGANAQLENARTQLASLGEQRAAELKRVLAMLGDVTAREYQATFDALGKLYDKLVAYASVAEDNVGDVWRIQEPLVACRFSVTGDSLSDPFLRHRISDITVSESSRRWAAVKDRLAADANADVSDLLND
jgi:DNA repair exonuclease SbcCD ATPase subunit